MASRENELRDKVFDEFIKLRSDVNRAINVSNQGGKTAMIKRTCLKSIWKTLSDNYLGIEYFFNQAGAAIVHDSLNVNQLREGKICIYSYFSRQSNVLEEQIKIYLSCLREAGYQIVFVSTSQLSADVVQQLMNFSELIIVRTNVCSDFGSIKVALQILNRRKYFNLLTALLLTNSSVIVDKNNIKHLLNFCERSKSDFSGQTQSNQYKLHLQSYFIYLNKSCFVEVLEFFQGFKLKQFYCKKENRTKKYIVHKGEIAFSQHLLNKGKHLASYIELSDLNTSSYDFVKKYLPPLIKKNILYFDQRNVLNISYFLDVAWLYGWIVQKTNTNQLGIFDPVTSVGEVSQGSTHFDTTPQINLYTIGYNTESLTTATAVLRLSNLENPKPEWREYYIFQTMYDCMIKQAEGARSNVFWGFLSWKFKQKTGFSERIFHQNISLSPGADLYFIDPYSCELSVNRFKHVFEQGEYYHPGITQLTNFILKKTGYDIDVSKIEYEFEKQGFCNFFVGNRYFWNEYIKFMRPIYECINKIRPAELPLLYQRADKKIDANYISFIIERLFSVFLHQKIKLKVKKNTL